MGCWGVNAFENDNAADWAFELSEAEDLSLVQDTLELVTDRSEDDEVVDADVACEALAACEVIARLKGNWGSQDAFSEPVDQWVTAHPSQPTANLVNLACSAIDSILGPESELAQLWDESGKPDEWKRAVQDLKARVKR
jgi:Domain of unknown function (DUF4259)